MDGKEQTPYAPDNNSYGGDVYADEIVVTYTYETITTPETTVLVSYTVDVSLEKDSRGCTLSWGTRDFQNYLYLE